MFAAFVGVDEDDVVSALFARTLGEQNTKNYYEYSYDDKNAGA